MPKNKSFVRSQLAHVAKIQLLLALAYGGQIIVIHAGHLVTPDIIMRRWIAMAIFTALTTWVWVVARSTTAETSTERKMAWLLAVTNIAFASYNVYLQRGMASRAVILYVLALFAVATLRSRVALYAAAVLSIAAYTTSAVMYFVLNFNEGYLLELYAEIGFYSVLLLLSAGMLSALVRKRR